MTMNSIKQIGDYALVVTTGKSFDDLISQVIANLKQEGFGILTTIDVKATLKEKLGADFKPYTILGACNPPLAHQALEADHLVGVFMPCNVVIWDEGDHRVVAAMNPVIMGTIISHPSLQKLAEEAKKRLERALEHLED